MLFFLRTCSSGMLLRWEHKQGEKTRGTCRLHLLHRASGGGSCTSPEASRWSVVEKELRSQQKQVRHKRNQSTWKVLNSRAVRCEKTAGGGLIEDSCSTRIRGPCVLGFLTDFFGAILRTWGIQQKLQDDHGWNNLDSWSSTPHMKRMSNSNPGVIYQESPLGWNDVGCV